MAEPWSADFSYDYYRKLIETAKRTFDFTLFREYPQREASSKPILLLRHDVDVSLERAVQMARIEHELGVRATYMVIPNSPLYSMQDDASREHLATLRGLGHDVGLHFDPAPEDRAAETPAEKLRREIDAACRVLGEASGQPIETISFHRPAQHFLRGPLLVDGRVNAYAAELMQWYLSDSKGRWREGEPMPRVQVAEKPVLQLLVHPIWWDAGRAPPTTRLRAFFDAHTRGASAEESARFSAKLHEALPEDWPQTG